ncbi:MAG TPA: TetR/AcrR family transcriptional regulator [Gemmataceae bacterium]|nr:TetR/AcrR family transcriptional regulator [Gemmataceae bacterium]
MRTKTPLQAEKMLQAAAALFGTQRFHEVRMEDIATAAGVGKGTIYRYFSDKEDLYLALLERASKQMHDGLERAVGNTKGANAKLRAVVSAIVSFFDEQPHLLSLIQREEVLRGPEFPWKKTRQEMLSLVTGLLEEGNAKGEISARDPELVALLLLAGLRGVLRFGKRPRPRDLAQRIVDIFLKGAVLEAKDGTHFSTDPSLYSEASVIG